MRKCLKRFLYQLVNRDDEGCTTIWSECKLFWWGTCSRWMTSAYKLPHQRRSAEHSMLKLPLLFRLVGTSRPKLLQQFSCKHFQYSKCTNAYSNKIKIQHLSRKLPHKLRLFSTASLLVKLQVLFLFTLYFNLIFLCFSISVCI